MAHFHPSLTPEKWNAYPRSTQILNIASELTRAKNRLGQNNREDLFHSLDRVIELADLTIADCKWRGGYLREMLRWREMIGGFYSVEHASADELNDYMKILLRFDPETSQVET